MTTAQLVTIIVAIVTSNAAALWAFIRFIIERNDTKREKKNCYATKDDIKPLHDGIKLILGQSILDLADHYIETGYISPEEWDELDEWFKVYTANHGNGRVAARYEKCRSIYYKN